MSGDRWRQGVRVPHHVYRQLGPEPDRRPWPDRDPPVAMFLDPADAMRAVVAVNAQLGEAAPKKQATSVLIEVEQDFIVRRHGASVDPHQCGDALEAEVVVLGEWGVIRAGGVSIDSSRNIVRLHVTVRADDLGEGVVQAITAVRTAVHAASEASLVDYAAVRLASWLLAENP